MCPWQLLFDVHVQPLLVVLFTWPLFQICEEELGTGVSQPESSREGEDCG